jgi:hypothetical protein
LWTTFKRLPPLRGAQAPFSPTVLAEEAFFQGMDIKHRNPDFSKNGLATLIAPVRGIDCIS